MLAAAAILVLAVAGSWFAFRQTETPDPPHRRRLKRQLRWRVWICVHLRSLAPTSRRQQQPSRDASRARERDDSAARWLVTRRYDLRILDGDLRVRASAKGSAEIRNYITTLEAAIDVGPLDAGEYQLTLRREGGEWQMFPLRVR